RTFLQRPQEFHIIRGPFLELAFENGVADPSEPLEDTNLFMPKVLSIFDEIWKTYYDDSSNKSKRVFCKEHTNFFLKFTSGSTILSDSRFLEMTHTFLIRNPEKSAKSLYKANNFAPKDSVFSTQRFSKDIVGLKETKQIFDLLKELNKPLVVVDADDLINDPERVLKKYCELIGEEFKEEMTHWEAKPVKEWVGNKNIAEVSNDAENSTGFNKFTDKHNIEIEFPQIVYDAIEDSKPYYDYLYQFRI
ncbi:12817_t:CDS:2, partial [Racocetra persica]